MDLLWGWHYSCLPQSPSASLPPSGFFFFFSLSTQARPCSECFAWINSFSFHNQPKERPVTTDEEIEAKRLDFLPGGSLSIQA